ncbi:hypothetical protein DFH11DRAFT_1542328 [Phellopilus nigrolimitatus]|nr:hypothetical protein DFH11DRAFT_1542328 [Phellopilus nigrolimitatus]
MLAYVLFGAFELFKDLFYGSINVFLCFVLLVRLSQWWTRSILCIGRIHTSHRLKPYKLLFCALFTAFLSALLFCLAATVPKNAYQLFGVLPGADSNSLRHAFNRYQKLTHPDRTGFKSDEVFIEGRKLYEMLRDASLKPLHDLFGITMKEDCPLSLEECKHIFFVLMCLNYGMAATIGISILSFVARWITSMTCSTYIAYAMLLLLNIFCKWVKFPGFSPIPGNMGTFPILFFPASGYSSVFSICVIGEPTVFDTAMWRGGRFCKCTFYDAQQGKGFAIFHSVEDMHAFTNENRNLNLGLEPIATWQQIKAFMMAHAAHNRRPRSKHSQRRKKSWFVQDISPGLITKLVTAQYGSHLVDGVVWHIVLVLVLVFRF